MAQDSSSRFNLPYLAVGQAQKEITHNEALIMIDALLHPAVEAELITPPTALDETHAGRCWLVGSGASGVWQNKAGQLACWTGNSWRFLIRREGMRVRNLALGVDMTATGSGWIAPGIVANPSSGTVVDSEARAAISGLLSILRSAGSIGT